MAINLIQMYVTRCFDAINNNILISNIEWNESIPRVRQITWIRHQNEVNESKNQQMLLHQTKKLLHSKKHHLQNE